MATEAGVALVLRALVLLVLLPVVRGTVDRAMLSSEESVAMGVIVATCIRSPSKSESKCESKSRVRKKTKKWH
jgi:hypothetical protein